ncbi:hypothetical protein MBLNU13_g03282t1 [Cladosporium sp. NU13]
MSDNLGAQPAGHLFTFPSENTEVHVGLTCDAVGFEDSVSEDVDDAALDDLHQHARPHIDQMRKLSLKTSLTNSYDWGEAEDKDRWFEEMASELVLLSEAPYLGKLHVTLEAYKYNQGGQKLADLTNQRSQVVRKIQEGSTWTAAKSAEYHDVVNHDKFFEGNSPLREQVRLMSGEVEMRFHEILEGENELMDLRKEIASTEQYLRWVVESRSKHHQTA